MTIKTAKQRNFAVMKHIERRAALDNAVLGPCLQAYEAHLESLTEPKVADYVGNLTRWLLEAKETTEKMIQAAMQKKWAHDPDRIWSSVTNSLRRSAGTNYQSLVSYALARYLHDTDAAWYVQYPVPRKFREALAINFGLPAQDGVSPGAIVTVQPDVDILLRNSHWTPKQGKREPILLLSVKTSLVDRAGMAARWKTYFDAATTLCEDCGTKMGIHLQDADTFEVNHGIVTANIYKYFFHDKSYQKGELESGQTKSNTYMFELKFTTRNDGLAVTPKDWMQFERIVAVLENIARKHGL